MIDDRRLSYLARCPGGDHDAWWHACARVDPDVPLDLAVTDVSFDIECPVCGPQAPAPRRPEPVHRVSVSSRGWLGRTA